MNLEEEIEYGFQAARAGLDMLQERFAQGGADPAAIRETLAKIVSAVMSIDRPAPAPGRPAQGYGFTGTEKRINAYQREHGGSLRAAVNIVAHPDSDRDSEEVASAYRQIRRKRDALEEIGEDWRDAFWDEA